LLQVFGGLVLDSAATATGKSTEISNQDQRFDRLAFFHVPKTAGTTLGDTLGKWFSPLESWLQPNSQDYVTFREGVGTGTLRYVSGHLRPKLHGELFGPDWLKVLLLRSPLTHLPSQFYHFSHAHNHDTEQNSDLLARAKSMDFPTFLRSGDSNLDFLPLFDNPQIRFILNLRNDPLTNAHLDEAISIMSDFGVVGVRERLLQTAHVVAAKFGRPAPRSLPRLRTGGANNPFHIDSASRDAIDAILERTRFDDQLFRWAWARLDRQTGTLQDSLPIETPPRSAEERPIMLFDLFIDERRQVRNVEWGTEGMTLGDRIVLHPPMPEFGEAELWMDDVELAGQSQISTEVHLPDVNSPDVIFSCSLICGEQVIAETHVQISAGQRVTMKTAILPPRFGKATIRLATQVASGWDRNHYASAIFHNARVE
jgi:hypothetical protein